MMAYLPPVLLAGQGVLLWTYLNSFAFDGRAVALGLILFAVHLLESTGILSPEDWENQPWRARYFESRMKFALGAVGVAGALALGLIVWGVFGRGFGSGMVSEARGSGFFRSEPFGSKSDVSPLRLFGSLSVCGVLFLMYWGFRWRTVAWLKPLMVSLAWVVLLCGFTSVAFLIEFRFLVAVFLLLVLDSLWLDFRDDPGDRLFHRGSSAQHFLFPIRYWLHVGVAVVIFSLFQFGHYELHFANGYLLFVGACSFRSTSRWVFGMLVSLWPLVLFVA